MERLFVYTVAFDEVVCRGVMTEWITRAVQPQRLSFGICIAAPGKDNSALVPQDFDPARIRVCRVSTATPVASGSARSQAQALYQSEEFVLSLDPRATCVDGWDALLLTEFSRCDGMRCVLTAGPSGGSGGEQPARIATVFVGNLFGRAASILDVPSDPEIDGLEEGPALAARLYTHGYDIYEQASTIFRYPAEPVGCESPPQLRVASLKRLASLGDGSAFGLGNLRSLDAEAVEGPSVNTFPDAVTIKRMPIFEPDNQSFYSPALMARNAPPGLLIMHEYLDARACRALVTYAAGQPSKPLGVGTSASNDTGDQAFRSDAVRVTEEIRIDGMTCEIINLFNDIYCYRVAPFFNTLFEVYERPQILRYPIGGRYLAHADADVWDGDQQCWVRALYRDYSVLLYINDDYEGGTLHFYAQNYTLRPRAGMLVAFPSDHRYVHEAQPTTAGIRYALVSWGMTIDSKPAKFPYRAVHVPLMQRPLPARAQV